MALRACASSASFRHRVCAWLCAWLPFAGSFGCGRTEQLEDEAPDRAAGHTAGWHHPDLPDHRQFVDVTLEAGIDYEHAPDYLLCGGCVPPQVMTGGAAASDYDDDGWVDLFVTRLDGPNLLYHNEGDGRFRDVSRDVGLGDSLRSNGAVWADVDNDGDLDLFVSVVELLVEEQGTLYFHLYINDGGQFVDQAIERGVSRRGPQLHRGFTPAFGDYDRDGFLDLYLTEWVPRRAIPDAVPVDFNTRLFRNLGKEQPGYFEDTTDVAGVDQASAHPEGAYSFASAFSDLDDDGWPDLAVVADFGSSRLYWNNGDGTFVDGTQAAGVGTDENGMGIALDDYDQDGDIDWFVSSIACELPCPANISGTGVGVSGNRLYRNEGGRLFTDATDLAELRHGYWGWGTQFFDYDNDRDLDLILTNGYRFPSELYLEFYEDPMRFWENDGSGFFVEQSENLGVSSTASGKGLAVFDYDNDGDLDVFVVNNTGPSQLFRNDGSDERGFLQVRLRGTTSNSHGVGARVTLTSEGLGAPMLRELRASGQFLAQNGYTLHFGLGLGAGRRHELHVRWPSGVEQTVEVEPNQRIDVIEAAP